MRWCVALSAAFTVGTSTAATSTLGSPWLFTRNHQDFLREEAEHKKEISASLSVILLLVGDHRLFCTVLPR